jgi:hypothetical protein
MSVLEIFVVLTVTAGVYLAASDVIRQQRQLLAHSERALHTSGVAALVARELLDAASPPAELKLWQHRHGCDVTVSLGPPMPLPGCVTPVIPVTVTATDAESLGPRAVVEFVRPRWERP